MNRKETLLTITLILLAILLAFASGYMLRDLTDGSEATFPILEQSYQLLTDNAFEALPIKEEMEYGMIRGMIEAYGDPFTSFNEPAEHELQTDSLEGRYAGIGARVERSESGEIILYPFPDGPSAEAGVLNGDILSRIDDMQVTQEMEINEIIAQVRGKAGTRVRISILRPPDLNEFEFSIRREEVPIPSVTWRSLAENAEVGIVEVNIMAESTADEIRNAIEMLRSNKTKYFVLDLRNNGGGLLSAGVDCAKLFVEPGVIIIQEFKHLEPEIFETKQAGEFVNLPMIVWVNRNTASAAEICAGAIQAQGNSKLAGTPTLGKDAIQLVFELADESSIQITASKWKFKELQFPNSGMGLLPDIEITEDSLAETSIEYFGSK